MITHGNKQISEIVYARKASEGGGAVRLTNIIRGAQVVFGGLYPDVKNWLEKATKAAILAAFGQTDGKAVIKATNAYLNALAATDPTKASALAWFINEDPMLVCSIVETGKTRWIKSDNKARIQTSVVTTLQTSVELHFMTGSISGALMGGNNWSANSWLTQLSGNTIRWHWTSEVLNPPIAANTEYHATFAANYINLNGVERTGIGASKVGEMVELFYCKNRGCDSSIAKATFKEGEQIVGEYVPYLTPDGTCGMLDIISFTFYPNANTSGSFTIEYTLPDGTPWTPLNQTP